VFVAAMENEEAIGREGGARMPVHTAWVCLALVAVLFAVIRVRLRNVPLERDEGEYAYAGQLILHGMSPYAFCYTMKLPGTAAAYAGFFALFGEKRAAVHLGLLLVNFATVVVLYLLGKDLLGEIAGVVAAASFALLSTGPSVLGLAAHATQFVVLPAMCGILLLRKAIASQGTGLLFGSGILFGLAFLMKQPGICFLGFATSHLLVTQWRRLDRRALLIQLTALWAGAVVPFLLTCLLIASTGGFHQFWFWTVSYAHQYATMQNLSDGLLTLGNNASEAIGPAIGIWLIAASSVFAFLWDHEVNRQRVFLCGLLAFSFLGLCPGLYFRPHYFVLLLPAIALLCGAAIRSATLGLRWHSRSRALAVLPGFAFLLVFGWTIFQQRAFFLENDPVAACRHIYGVNPFPEAIEIARFLKDKAAPGDRVAVMGSEPEIYFYSRLRSATGYVYMYPLMEDQPYAPIMQKDLSMQIEATLPKFVVSVNVITSWMPRPDSDIKIWSWFDQFVTERYEQVGVADIFADKTVYRWGDEAKNYRPHSQHNVMVFQRKDSKSGMGPHRTG